MVQAPLLVLKISLDRITSCTGGNTIAWIGDGHSYLIHLCISLASMIHFLKNCFQNVLMTSQPWAPQAHQCFSGFRGFMWRFPGLSFPQCLLHCTPAICCGFPVLLQHWEQWWHQKFKCLGCVWNVWLQRHELGYYWRGCDQEWGRQGAGAAELGSTETTTFCCSWQGRWNTGLLYNSVIRCENPQTIKSYSVMYFNEPVEIYEI